MSSKKIAMAVGKGFEDLEFWAVYMRMKEEGALIRVMGLNAGATYTSKSGGLRHSQRMGQRV